MNVEEADNLNIKDIASLESTMPGIAQTVQKFFRVYKVGILISHTLPKSCWLVICYMLEHSYVPTSFLKALALYRFPPVMARTSLPTTGKSRTENWLRMWWSESEYPKIYWRKRISANQQCHNSNFKNQSFPRFLHEEWRDMMKNCSIGSVDGEFGMFSTLSTKQVRAIEMLSSLN